MKSLANSNRSHSFLIGIAAVCLAVSLMTPNAADAQDGDLAGATDINLESTDRPDAMGSLGIGYFTTIAPIGVRYWGDGDLGFDAGIGLGFGNGGGGMGMGGDTEVSFALEGGILYALKTWENAIMFARGGAGFSFSTGADGFGFMIDGMLGGEFFLTELGFPMLSFTGGIGLGIGISKPDGGDLTWGIGTDSDAVSIVATAGLGFHIYFM